MTLPLVRAQQWLAGALVANTDTLDMTSWARMKDSMLAHAVTGATSFLPAFNEGGIACVPGTGLSVLMQQVGGSDSCQIWLPQRADDGTWTSVNASAQHLAQAAYYTPPGGGQEIVISAAPPSSAPYRTDLICVQFLAQNVAPHSVNVRTGSVVNPTDQYCIEDTLNFTYVQGTPSATFPGPTPSVPSEFKALYSIAVEFGDSTLSPNDITLVMPTFDQLIGSMAGVILTTAPFACPTEGTGVTIQTNGAPSINGTYYLIEGPADNHVFIGNLVSGGGTDQLLMACVRVFTGTRGTNVNAGSIITPIAQPILFNQDATFIGTTVVHWSGVSTTLSASGTYNVPFPTSFATSANYRIEGLTAIGANLQPYVSAKNANGFTIAIPSSATGSGTVEWSLTGYFSP